MHYEPFDSCIKALHTCISACSTCALGGRHEANGHAMADCVTLNIDCMEICQLAISCIERDSKMTGAICEACIEICEYCQEECDKYQMDYCRACAEACRNCALQCEAVVAFLRCNRHRGHDAVIAGLRN